MFTPEQIKELSAKLDSIHVKKNAKDMDYVEGWLVTDTANRIFGFDGWSRELRYLGLVGEPYQDAKGNTRVGYRATVRVIVQAGEKEVFKDGTGYGSGIVKDPNDAHEKAMKEAETDALKRALKDFGNPFGLALYDKAKENVLTPAQKRAEELAEIEAEFAADLENALTVQVAGIDDVAALGALLQEQTPDIKRVGAYDRAIRDRIVAVFGKRKAELLALQPKAEAEPAPEVPTPPDSEPPKPAKQPRKPELVKTEPAAKVEPAPQAEPAATAAAQAVAEPVAEPSVTEPSVTEPEAPAQDVIAEVRTGQPTPSDDFGLAAELVVDPRNFPHPEVPKAQNWPDWRKACIVAIRKVQDEETLDKWVARHQKAIDYVSRFTKVGNYANGADMTGTNVVDDINLWLRRQRAILAGTSLSMRYGLGDEPGKVVNFYADASDWADGLNSMANSEAGFGNVQYNVEQARALIEAHKGTDIAATIKVALEIAREQEKARVAKQAAA